MAVKSTNKKSSVSTELVLGQAAQQISKAVNELNSATETVKQLVSQSEDLQLQVASKEAQIAELDVQYAEKARQAEVDFELTMKSNAEKLVTEFLKNSGRVAIAVSELEGLRQELSTIKAGFEQETKKQVAQVTNMLKSQHENELKLLQSENKAVAVENTSKIAVLQEKNSFLEAQVTKLYNQLDAERAAGTERAKAASIGNITVGGDSNRK